MWHTPHLAYSKVYTNLLCKSIVHVYSENRAIFKANWWCLYFTKKKNKFIPFCDCYVWQSQKFAFFHNVHCYFILQNQLPFLDVTRHSILAPHSHPPGIDCNISRKLPSYYFQQMVVCSLLDPECLGSHSFFSVCMNV